MSEMRPVKESKIARVTPEYSVSITEKRGPKAVSSGPAE